MEEKGGGRGRKGRKREEVDEGSFRMKDGEAVEIRTIIPFLIIPV